MDSHQKTARIAGLLYLVVVLTGIFSLAYVPSKLFLFDSAAQTTSRIIASETLFRLSIFAGIICYLAFLILPFVLYKLFQPVNKTYAGAMVILAVTSVPISLLNLNHKFAILTLINNATQLELLPEGQLQAQVLLHLHYYNSGIQIASVFWGLWLLPLGYLILKSGILPKVLGILLMAGCFGYLVNFTGRLLYPNYSELGISSFIAMPATIGEIGTCLWLLIAGAKQQQLS